MAIGRTPVVGGAFERGMSRAAHSMSLPAAVVTSEGSSVEDTSSLPQDRRTGQLEPVDDNNAPHETIDYVSRSWGQESGAQMQLGSPAHSDDVFIDSRSVAPGTQFIPAGDLDMQESLFSESSHVEDSFRDVLLRGKMGPLNDSAVLHLTSEYSREPAQELNRARDKPLGSHGVIPASQPLVQALPVSVCY